MYVLGNRHVTPTFDIVAVNAFRIKDESTISLMGMLNPEAAGFVTTSHSHVAIKVGQTGTSTWLSNGKRRFAGGLLQTPFGPRGRGWYASLREAAY
jgi:ribosomal protein S16